MTNLDESAVKDLSTEQLASEVLRLYDGSISMLTAYLSYQGPSTVLTRMRIEELLGELEARGGAFPNKELLALEEAVTRLFTALPTSRKEKKDD